MMAPTPMTQALDLLEAAWRRTAVLNRKMIGLAHSNLRFGFELARAKTLSDVLSLQADYWQKQWDVFQAEDAGNEPSETAEARHAEKSERRRVEGASAQRPVESAARVAQAKEAQSAKPPKARADDAAAAENAEAAPPSREQKLVAPQTEAKVPAGLVKAAIPETVVAEVPEKPTRRPAQKSVPKALPPDRQVEKKSAKGRAKPTQDRQTSNEARASERKARARERNAVSPSGAGKIQFGMLDGNAVRFTSAEAWAWREGAWKRVPVDEVQSEAVVLSQARFDKLYPDVPELPASAFQPKGKPER